MSSLRGGGYRGRGRGSGGQGAPSTAPRGPSSNRGRGDSNAARRNNNAPRGGTAAAARGTAAFTPRGRGGLALPPTFAPKAIGGILASTGDWAARQKQLTTNREQEKKDAIAQGLMSDPDKAIALSQAITLVGTCQDMCPEHERVTRAMRNELWDPEKDDNGQADESRMVKRFKRSAAGDEVQLPSDLRPPHVLKRVCDYLFHELIEDDDSLAKNHHFVWDRTRGIRNDFSVQQISRVEDLRIAIDCFERIARFHILSLHLLAKQPKPYETYSEQQDREQLDRTLLSLLQYYDDVRGRLDLPNEPEFRAYCVIFQLRDPTPDLDDRVQSWPRSVRSDPRVQIALEIHAAACSTMYPEGPMETAKHVVARQHWERFWALVISKKVSYLMGCVAEVYFNLLRHMMLNAIVRTARKARPARDGEQIPPNMDFKLNDLWIQFNFDHEDELKEFFGRWGLQFQTGPDGVEFLDIRHVAGRNLPEPRKEGPKQLRSEIVEVKRNYRTIPAVIDGMSVRQAREAGMIGLVEEGDEMSVAEGEEQDEKMRKEDEDDGESLFVSPDKTSNDLFKPKTTEAVKPASGFGQPSASPFGQNGFSFGQPSGSGLGQASPFGQQPAAPLSNPYQKPLDAVQAGKEAPKNPFGFLNPPAAPAQKLLESATTTNPFALPSSTVTAAASEVGQAAISPKTTVFGQPTANPFLNPFATKKEEAPKEEAAKTRLPKKLTGPFIEDESPETSPSKSSAEDVTSTPAPTWSLPKSDTSTATSGPTFNAPQASAVNSESSPAQPHASPPPTTTNGASANSSNQHAPVTNGLGQPGSRRFSLSTSTSAGVDHHKPKKPSPLSNSFTAGADTAAAQQRTLPEKETVVAKPAAPRPTFSQFPQPAAVTPPPPDFETILTRLAKEITFAPGRGILKDFVEYTLKKTIEEVHARVRREQEIEIREYFLFRKYGGRWRAIVPVLRHRRRLAEKGHLARERTRRRLAESQRSERESPRGRDKAMSLFQHTRNGRAGDEGQAQAGSKRPASGEEEHGSASTNGISHKRSRTADNANGIARVASPFAASNADSHDRSSFLSFSLPLDNPYRAPTTRSTYFRMKARGIPSMEGVLRGTKRPRAGSDVASAVPATLLKPSPPTDSNTEQARNSQSMPPPSARSERSRMSDGGDALLERVRKAREALSDGNFMEGAAENPEEFRRSLSNSLSSNESPSMERARVEARLRASQGLSDYGASFGARDVPAYRFRQSRFVSAEEQARAIERAHEIRASRGSRESSRPGSRMEEPTKPTTSPIKPKPGLAPQQPTHSNRTTATVTNGNSKSSAEPAKPATSAPPTSLGASSSRAFTSQASAAVGSLPSTFGARRDPFSQSSSFAPPTTNGNPFLQHSPNSQAGPSPSQSQLFTNNSTPPHTTQLTASTPAAQPATQGSHDNTIPRSQIPEALSHTFGQSHPTGQSRLSMPSQSQDDVISLLSDDEDDEPTGADSGAMAYGQQQYFGNGMVLDPNFDFTNGVAPQSLVQALDQGLQDQQTYTNNRFGALANDVSGDEDEIEQQWNESDEDEFGRQQEQSIQNTDQYSDEEADDGSEEEGYDEYEMPNGQHYGFAAGADEEAASDGLVEDADEEDEGDYDEEDDYDTEEDHGDFFNGPPLKHAYNQHAEQGPKNTALQDGGNTAEEAIELSD